MNEIAEQTELREAEKNSFGERDRGEDRIEMRRLDGERDRGADQVASVFGKGGDFGKGGVFGDSNYCQEGTELVREMGGAVKIGSVFGIGKGCDG